MKDGWNHLYAIYDADLRGDKEYTGNKFREGS